MSKIIDFQERLEIKKALEDTSMYTVLVETHEDDIENCDYLIPTAFYRNTKSGAKIASIHLFKIAITLMRTLPEEEFDAVMEKLYEWYEASAEEPEDE